MSEFVAEHSSETQAGLPTAIDSFNRMRAALENPEQYIAEHGNEIRKRIEHKQNSQSHNHILFSTYSGKGLPWAIDQFSRQSIPDFRAIVFQNGKKRATPEQQAMESFCDQAGVDYVQDDIGYGPWGGRAYATHNYEKLFCTDTPMPAHIATFDEDTGPVFPDFLERTIALFEQHPRIGAVYSPALFITQGNLRENISLLAYKGATLTAQWIKTHMGRYHTVGSNAVFRASALLEDRNNNVWNQRSYNDVREDDMAHMLLENGYSLTTCFDPKSMTFSSGDRLVREGVGRYFTTIATSHLPPLRGMKQVQRWGEEQYKKMYSNS